MKIQFEQGNRDAPVGHALLYFQADGAILATYITLPPITFNIGNYMPAFMAPMMQGTDLTEAMGASPVMLPPIPEQVESVEYLQALASQRQDDLLFGGVTTRSNPMLLAQEAAEAAAEYAELYHPPAPGEVPTAVRTPAREASHFADLTEQERLMELSQLVGRMRESLGGPADIDVERQMQDLAELLPAKYRVRDLIGAARVPGERGQRLAELYIERAFKLFNEDYLDLERIDREIESNQA